jgi:hypothetical protein
MRKLLPSFAAWRISRPIGFLLPLLMAFTIVKAQSGKATVSTDQLDYRPVQQFTSPGADGRQVRLLPYR